MDYRFDDASREAVYQVISDRRDVRSFLPDDVPEDLLWRILEAAHQAPSVGFMQPWNFIVVRHPDKKRLVYEHFLAVNTQAADVYDEERARAYRTLKLQGILDAPLGLLVTCDRERGGPHVLGRATTRDTDLYSTCLAIQNLWLAARAEGLGVGWMSLMEESAIRDIFGLPPAVVPVAYLCLGFPVELPDAPLLGRVGWRERLPLTGLVYTDRWANPYTTPGSPYRGSEVQSPVRQPDPYPGDDVSELSPDESLIGRFERMPVPKGALGRIEALTKQLARIQKRARPTCQAPWIAVFAGDHGIARNHALSAYAPSATTLMVYRFLSDGSVVNAFARQAGAGLVVADLGVDHHFGEARALIRAKIRAGTRDFSAEEAMTPVECQDALLAGRQVFAQLRDCDVLVLGEMGIGNSTAAAAICAALLAQPLEELVGRGTGIGDDTLSRKKVLIQGAIALHCLSPTTCPKRVLQCVGGYEIAGMVGAILAASEANCPVLLDGFITGVAALVAARINPLVKHHLIAGSCSPEPAHASVLRALELEPLLDLGLRLGEGSAAALALPLVQNACRLAREVSTYEEANVSEPLSLKGRQ